MVVRASGPSALERVPGIHASDFKLRRWPRQPAGAGRAGDRMPRVMAFPLRRPEAERRSDPCSNRWR